MYRKKLYHIQNHLERNFPEIERRNTIMAKTKQEKIASIQEQIQQLKTKKSSCCNSRKSRNARTEQNAFASAWGFLKACCPIPSPSQTSISRPFLKKPYSPTKAAAYWTDWPRRTQPQPRRFAQARLRSLLPHPPPNPPMWDGFGGHFFYYRQKRTFQLVKS